MSLQSAVEVVLALSAVLLLARDLHRAWLDPAQRPLTLLVAALATVLLVGTVGGGAHPSPWWLALPATILIWEVGRGWRQTPRCHIWETGVGAFAASLLLAVAGLGLDAGGAAETLLAASAGLSVVALGLLWLSRRREPRPWRARDASHYERRANERSNGLS